MARPVEWIRTRRTTTMAWVAVALLVVALLEAFFLYQQQTAIRASEVQSQKLLRKFLQGEGPDTSGARGVAIRLENVRFRWSEKIFIDAHNIAMRAIPLQGSVVDFDDLDHFRLKLQRSAVFIRPSVLEGMFNESVFNYPHSKLRDLKVELKEDDHLWVVGVSGKLNMGVWIPFRMSTRLSVDKATNTLVIDSDDVKVLGFLPASGLMKLKPFQMRNLLTLPPNNSLIVDKNKMMVKPFGLFPPPRVEGILESVAVRQNDIAVTFAGDPIPAPHAPAKNYVYLRGGISQFGNIRMYDTNVLILDADPSDVFDFSLQNYPAMIPKSDIRLQDTKSAVVVMKDF